MNMLDRNIAVRYFPRNVFAIQHSVFPVFVLMVFVSFFNSSLAEAGTRDIFLFTSTSYRLKSSALFEKRVGSELECAHLCIGKTEKCQSINVERETKRIQRKLLCQLNNETKQANMKNLVSDSSYNYHEPKRLQEGVFIPFHQPAATGTVVYRNCADLYKNGVRKDGTYSVCPDKKGSIQVRCDMTTAGGGWTIFQRRLDGSVDFHRGWDDYQNGFGQIDGEYWLGLDRLHRFTNSGDINILRVDLEDFEGERRYAQYDEFNIGSEAENYKLYIENYLGNAGDSLAYHNGMMFTTKDRDNDLSSEVNCAVRYIGAWWYNWCHHSNINGYYYGGSHTNTATGVNWSGWRGNYYSLKMTEMKFRPAGFV